MLENVKRLRWIYLPLAVALMLVTASCEDDDDEDENESFPVISPSSVRLTAAEEGEVIFTVRAGTPEYTWTLLDASLGALVDAGTTAIYKSAPVAGVNIVTVTDARSNAVSATITQL